jgi:tRNA (mo5U34)-methyltransferase
VNWRRLVPWSRLTSSWGRGDAPFPTEQDDRRLQGWYHTIDLGNGLVTQGEHDHRRVVDRYGLPARVDGLTALDVGTCDGFWAFELERRGAKRVVAIDVERYGDFDWLSGPRAELGRLTAKMQTGRRFAFAHAVLRSKVDRRVLSVYDLSPTTAGTFDLVFCGDVLVHLQNPLLALVNIRSVTKRTAIVATMGDAAIDTAAPAAPWVAFGDLDAERAQSRTVGSSCIYWRFGSRALRDALEYAGFTSTEALPPVQLPSGPRVTVVVAHAH